jgi:hypothetical protein
MRCRDKCIFLSLSLAIVVSTISLAATSTRPETFVGRWKSEIPGIGWYIIDRYSDGNFIQKACVVRTMGEPPIVSLAWGRWSVNGSRYILSFQFRSDNAGPSTIVNQIQKASKTSLQYYQSMSDVKYVDEQKQPWLEPIESVHCPEARSVPDVKYPEWSKRSPNG